MRCKRRMCVRECREPLSLTNLLCQTKKLFTHPPPTLHSTTRLEGPVSLSHIYKQSPADLCKFSYLKKGTAGKWAFEYSEGLKRMWTHCVYPCMFVRELGFMYVNRLGNITSQLSWHLRCKMQILG